MKTRRSLKSMGNSMPTTQQEGMVNALRSCSLKQGALHANRWIFCVVPAESSARALLALGAALLFFLFPIRGDIPRLA